eukprot:68320-Pyramimonas_sp.AAC.1
MPPRRAADFSGEVQSPVLKHIRKLVQVVRTAVWVLGCVRICHTTPSTEYLALSVRRASRGQAQASSFRNGKHAAFACSTQCDCAHWCTIGTDDSVSGTQWADGS